MYDVIGDVHAYYAELCALFEAMRYRYDPTEHIFIPPYGRKALFIGDYVDRGPENKRVVTLARNMTRKGYAHALMGNHEFNAILWTIKDPYQEGKFLRGHSSENARLHQTFLDEANTDPEFYEMAIEWFKTLPIYLSHNKRHFVHACWHLEALHSLQHSKSVTLDNRLTQKGWMTSARPHSDDLISIETLLKGPEERMASGLFYRDAHGNRRRRARIAWWQENAKTFGEAYSSIPSEDPLVQLPYTPSEPHALSQRIREALQALPQDEKIFIGHIWRDGVPMPLSRSVCCVDYGVAKPSGKLVAYQDDDHEGFSLANYIWVERPNPNDLTKFAIVKGGLGPP